MENLLVDYMNRRFSEGNNQSESVSGKGPVITISRQTGCGGSALAFELTEVFNQLTNEAVNLKPWRYINREILEKSAAKLNLDPKHLIKVLTDKERGMMDQIVEALSTHSHKSDQRIMKTIHDVVRQFAEQGNIIIVGRGGAMVSHDMDRSLHIRLEAPAEWRAEATASKLGFSKDFAMEYILKRDEEREMFLKKLLSTHKNSNPYDIVLNPERLNIKQMTGIILTMARMKHIL